MSKKSAAVLPGYETVFLNRVDMTDEALKQLKEKLFGIVQAFDGELVYQEDWGKRKLSYPIQKETRAQYTYFVYTGKGDVVAEIERNLRLTDTVLRFMTVNLAKEFNKETFMKEMGTGTSLKREERGATETTPTQTA